MHCLVTHGHARQEVERALGRLGRLVEGVKIRNELALLAQNSRDSWNLCPCAANEHTAESHDPPQTMDKVNKHSRQEEQGVGGGPLGCNLGGSTADRILVGFRIVRVC